MYVETTSSGVRPRFLRPEPLRPQVSIVTRHAAKGRAGYSVFGKALALVESKAVGETTPSRPCRRGPRVLCVTPQLLAAAQHRVRWQLACIASRLPRLLSRRVSQRRTCTSIFWAVSTICPTFWRSIQVSVCSSSVSARLDWLVPSQYPPAGSDARQLPSGTMLCRRQ